MSLKDLLNNETIQGLLIEGEKLALNAGLDALEAAVERTATNADNEALAALLETAASRVREKTKPVEDGNQ